MDSRPCLRGSDRFALHGWFVHVSAITAWEVGLLVAKGQVKLGQPVAEWFESFCDAQNIHVLHIHSRSGVRGKRTALASSRSG